MANMCVDAEGYKEAEEIRFGALSYAANIKKVLAVAQAVVNSTTAINNYKKLRDITSLGIRLEEEQHAHLKNTYWPAEEQMLGEFTVARTWDSQAVLAKRYAGKMWAPMAAQFAREIRKLECEKPRYCGNAFLKRMQELQVQRAATRSNVTLLADRIAFYEVAAIQETDAERRKQVIAMRQGLLGQAATFMAQAAAGYGGAQANAMGAINNAIQTIGMAMTEGRQAQAGMGRDPYFHSRTAQSAADFTAQQSYSDSDMARQNAAFDRDWEYAQTAYTITPDSVSNANMYAGEAPVTTALPVEIGTMSSPNLFNTGMAPE